MKNNNAQIIGKVDQHVVFDSSDDSISCPVGCGRNIKSDCCYLGDVKENSVDLINLEPSSRWRTPERLANPVERQPCLGRASRKQR